MGKSAMDGDGGPIGACLDLTCPIRKRSRQAREIGQDWTEADMTWVEWTRPDMVRLELS